MMRTIQKNKTYLVFLLFVSITSFSCKKENLATNPKINSVFEKDEVQDLSKILDFFEQQICSTEELDINNNTLCYTHYLKKLKVAEITGNIEIGISVETQRQLYNQINDSTLNQIWVFHKSSRRNSSDTLKQAKGLRYDGKYVAFLQELSKDNPAIKQYYETFIAVGAISPSMINSILVDYKNYNIKDRSVKFVIAIHYLTLNDNPWEECY